MIPVAKTSPPPEFATECQEAGQQWLAAHPESRSPADYWKRFDHALREAFHRRCGWAGFEITDGQVDHFIPVARLLGTPDAWRIYDWNNFRYILGRLNGAKGDREVLDPFEVEPDWFRLDIRTLHVVATDLIPTERRAVAEETARRLCNNYAIVRHRRETFDLWKTRKVSLRRLDEFDPLLSAAIRRELAKGRNEWLRSLSP